MRFSSIILALSAISGVFGAAEQVDPAQKSVKFNSEKEQEDVQPTVNADDLVLTDFKLTYILEDFADAEPTELVELLNSKPLAIAYTLANNEEKDITVVGLGGTFRNPLTGEIATNLTATSVGPHVVKPGKSLTFKQKINLNMFAANYVLAPVVYIAYDDSLKMIDARAQLVTIVEEPISFFNPQLLFVEVILVAVIGAVVHFLYPNLFKKYINGTAPVKVPTSAKGTTSGYDPNWIPKSHLTQPKKTKAKTRKAY